MKELIMIKLWIVPEMKVFLEILYPFGGQIRLILVNWGELKFEGPPFPQGGRFVSVCFLRKKE